MTISRFGRPDALARTIQEVDRTQRQIERHSGFEVPRRVCARIYHDANQSVSASTTTILSFNSTLFNLGMGHSTEGAIAGTVTKAAGATTLVGVGTSFTTALVVGDLISVPGTAVEYNTIVSIESDTAATVRVAWANSALGQTLTVRDDGLVCLVPGYYLVGCHIGYNNQTTNGTRRVTRIVKNESDMCYDTRTPVSGNPMRVVFSYLFKCELYDFLQVSAYQDGAGAVYVPYNQEFPPGMWAVMQV